MGDSTMRDGRPAAASMHAPDEPRSTGRGEGSAFNFSERQDSESIPDLLRDLVQQGGHLAEQQTKLVQAEMRSAVGEMKESVGAMAGAAVLGIAGIGVVLMAISYLLGSIMPMWLATLIVGVAALIGAYAMFKGSQDKLQSGSLTMDRTRRTIERAPSAMSGEESEGRHGR